VPNVAREVDGRHATRAELALYRVPLGKRNAQRFGDGTRGGHCGTMTSERSKVND
jgi:hypothetical protein